MVANVDLMELGVTLLKQIAIQAVLSFTVLGDKYLGKVCHYLLALSPVLWGQKVVL